MFPALRKLVAAYERPMARRSAALRGVANAQGARAPRASGGARTTSCHSGSRWRAYQATYSSPMGRVAGCRVTSSTRPSPMIQTRRPSRRPSRYSAPLLTADTPSSRGVEERRGVVEFVELHHLTVPEAPEVGLRRVDHAAGGAILPRGGAAHRHPVALAANFAGDPPPGAAVGQRAHADVVRHEVEPRLDAAALRLVPLAIGVLQPRHVLPGIAHGVW